VALVDGLLLHDRSGGGYGRNRGEGVQVPKESELLELLGRELRGGWGGGGLRSGGDGEEGGRNRTLRKTIQVKVSTDLGKVKVRREKKSSFLAIS